MRRAVWCRRAFVASIGLRYVTVGAIAVALTSGVGRPSPLLALLAIAALMLVMALALEITDGLVNAAVAGRGVRGHAVAVLVTVLVPAGLAFDRGAPVTAAVVAGLGVALVALAGSGVLVDPVFRRVLDDLDRLHAEAAARGASVSHADRVRVAIEAADATDATDAADAANRGGVGR